MYNTIYDGNTLKEQGLVLVSTGFLKFGKPLAGRVPCQQSETKYKRRRKFSVRCLVAAVGLRSLAA